MLCSEQTNSQCIQNKIAASFKVLLTGIDPNQWQRWAFFPPIIFSAFKASDLPFVNLRLVCKWWMERKTAFWLRVSAAAPLQIYIYNIFVCGDKLERFPGRCLDMAESWIKWWRIVFYLFCARLKIKAAYRAAFVCGEGH